MQCNINYKTIIHNTCQQKTNELIKEKENIINWWKKFIVSIPVEFKGYKNDGDIGFDIVAFCHNTYDYNVHILRPPVNCYDVLRNINTKDITEISFTFKIICSYKNILFYSADICIIMKSEWLLCSLKQRDIYLRELIDLINDKKWNGEL